MKEQRKKDLINQAVKLKTKRKAQRKHRNQNLLKLKKRNHQKSLLPKKQNMIEEKVAEKVRQKKNQQKLRNKVETFKN